MRSGKKILMLVILALLTTAGVCMQQSGKPLTNQDVISMSKNALPESVILSAIKTNDTDFDVSANGLIALKKAGVTPKILQAMLAAAGNKRNSAPSAAAVSSDAPPVASNALVAAPATVAGATTVPAAAPAWQPTVSAFAGNSRVELPAQPTQIVHTKAKVTSLAALAADQALTEALNLGTQAAEQEAMKQTSKLGGPMMGVGVKVMSGFFGNRAKHAKISYVWALAGGSAPYVISGKAESFEINYAGIPGVNPDQFEPVIVKLALTPQANFRLLGATEATSSAEQSTQQDWPIYSSFVENRIPANVQKLSPGHARVTPASPLAAGEYAIALRPVDKSHKFSGEEVGKNVGEGLAFNYAWPVSVK